MPRPFQRKGCCGFSGRARGRGDALRPEPERPVRPHVHFANLTDRAGRDVLVTEPRLVTGMPLVPHLRDDLALFRLLRERPCFLDRPAERLLHVDVLAPVHRRKRDRRVHVIGRGHDHRVDVLLLVEHVPVVAVFAELRYLLLDEPPQILRAIRTWALLVGGNLRGSCLVTPTRRRLLSSRLIRRRRRIQLRLKPRQRPIEQCAIDVADRDDVLAQECAGIAVAHAPDADRGDVHRIARRLKPAPEHMPRHDDQPSSGCGRRGDELTSRLPLVRRSALVRISLAHRVPRSLELLGRHCSAHGFRRGFRTRVQTRVHDGGSTGFTRGFTRGFRRGFRRGFTMVQAGGWTGRRGEIPVRSP